MPIYEVIVGNIGLVYSGAKIKQARDTYLEYVNQSRIGHGRAGGEDVTMLKYGEPVWEFMGKLSRQQMKDED